MELLILRSTEVLILVVAALVSDLRTFKIKNAIVFPFLFVGLVTNILADGFGGLLFSMKGMMAPIAILIIFFVLRMLGAGDIKLFSAIGSIMGFEFIIYNMAYSFVSGGILALVLIIMRRNGIQRLRYMYIYIKSCFLARSILPYTDFEDKEDGAKFHMACAIAVGTVFCLLMRYWDSIP